MSRRVDPFPQQSHPFSPHQPQGHLLPSLPMHRFFLPQDRWTDYNWELPEEESRHLAKALRIREGDACIVFDGKGRAAKTKVISINSPNQVILAHGELKISAPPISEITLCQAIPKGGNMDLIIQKSVEMGVSHIIPLITERTIVRLTDKEASAKREKWQRNALEACKQCGQNTLPHVASPIRFHDWIQKGFSSSLPLLASLAQGACPIRDILEKARNQHCKQAALLVGPEGDFTESEMKHSIEAGFIPVSLGDIVLRVETATFFGMSAIRYALD